MPVKRSAPPAAPDPDDDDDTPTEAPARPSGTPTVKGGWGEGQKVLDSSSSWAQTFRPEEKSQIIKFLEDQPYAAFRRHWVERMNAERQKTNRAYTCLQSFGKTCPVCEVGDRATAVSAFNIAILDPSGDMTHKSWDVGARLFQVLKAYSNDPKIGPLTRGFFLVSKTGQRQSVQYNVAPIKASALEEDYDIPVPDEVALKAVPVYDASIVDEPKMKDMRDIADELNDDYS